MQLIVNILIIASLYSLIALSFYLIYSTTRYLHFSHAALITLSPYLINSFVENGTSLFIEIVLSLFIISILSLFIEKIYSVFFNTGNKWSVLIISIGVYVVLIGIISILWGNVPTYNIFFHNNSTYEIFNALITNIQIFVIFLSLGIFFMIIYILKHTKYGKKVIAVASNPLLSDILGINTSFVNRSIFVLGSMIASIAGILLSSDISFTPTIGFHYFLYSVIAMIIAGAGGYLNLFNGALLLATAQHLSAYYLDSKWMNATAFIILIAFLYFKPYGFSGKKLKKAEI